MEAAIKSVTRRVMEFSVPARRVLNWKRMVKAVRRVSGGAVDLNLASLNINGILKRFFMISVHPCDQENQAGCAQICTKKGEEAMCKCKTGFRLAKNDKYCTKVHPCENLNGGCEHICARQGDKALCKCKPGFTLYEDGKKCEKGT